MELDRIKTHAIYFPYRILRDTDTPPAPLNRTHDMLILLLAEWVLMATRSDCNRILSRRNRIFLASRKVSVFRCMDLAVLPNLFDYSMSNSSLTCSHRWCFYTVVKVYIQWKTGEGCPSVWQIAPAGTGKVQAQEHQPAFIHGNSSAPTIHLWLIRC